MSRRHKMAEKCRGIEHNYRIFRSLRTALTAIIFAIFSITWVAIGAVTVILYRLGVLPRLLLTPLVLPMVLLGVSVCLGTLLAGYIAKFVVSPLRSLVDAADAIKKGNYSIRVNEETPVGELNRLMKSFNSMSVELGNTELFRKDFINDFSHEFKTPIVSIRGFARQLQKDNELHFLTDEQRKQYTDIIANESDRLARLSTNILLLNKVEKQRIVTDKTEFYLDEQIRRSVLILEKEWSAKSIEFDLELDEIKYVFNEEMLSQVWLNLISNAVRFSPNESTVSISCHRRERMIVTEVADKGEGMDDETVKKIFDRFYQSDTSHKSEGNGLGLSIAKRIVELADGSIYVTSKLGEGSVFTVELPVVDEDEKAR